MEYKLIDEILKLSNSLEWVIARKEWNFELVYQSENYETCLCGHHPIINICVIKNKLNGITTEVGNCCINKFLGIDEGNRIFDSVNKLKKDKTKSLNIDALLYINKLGQLTDYEYKFYSDIMRKRKLSEKQLNLKIKINEKFLDFTSFEHNLTSSKLDKVIKWAEENQQNATYVLSLKSYFEKNNKLSEKQTNALNKIVEEIEANLVILESN